MKPDLLLKSVVIIGAVAWIGTLPMNVCACFSPAMNLESRLSQLRPPGDGPGTNISRDPADLQALFLSKAPVGSTEAEVREVLGRLDKHCQRDKLAYSCRFVAAQSLWQSEGYRLVAEFDAAGKLAKVGLTRF